MNKARQFLTAAEEIRRLPAQDEDMGDAFVTLCVHAGIAAADVICCAALGRYAQGESHNEAVALLRTVRPDGQALAKSLDVLLSMKTRAGYGYTPASADDRKRAERRARELVDAARIR